MDESSKLLLTVAIPTVTVLIGILVNNRQLDTKFDSLEKIMNAKFEATNQAILRVEGVLDARLKQVEEILKIR